MFRFKQFTVYHNLCAMKVGTDGVLIGAWADCSDAKMILDVGTGSGLIALMLAQRSKASRIDAVEIDENACKQAQINFGNSPFRQRLQVHFSPLQNFVPAIKYDLIVSNPPYFSQSLPSPNKNRTQARHNNSLSFEDLITNVKPLLSPQGKLSLILPADIFAPINACAWENDLFLCRKTAVSFLQEKPPRRVLLEYSLQKKPLIANELSVGKLPSGYTDEYIALTRDFYLE